jgi:hypothetical protein
MDIILIASRELVDDSRMGTAIGPRSRYMCLSVSILPLLPRGGFLSGNGAIDFLNVSKFCSPKLGSLVFGIGT